MATTALQMRQAVRDAQEAENRAVAAKIHAVAAYANQRTKMYFSGDDGPRGVDIERSANAELAAYLADSSPRVTRWLTEANHQYRIHSVGKAFDDGKITLAKLTIVREHSAHASKESLLRCEVEIMASVLRLAPKPLGVEIERILAEDDADFKDRAHAASMPSRKVRATSAAHGMGRVTTTGTAEEAAEIAASVLAMTVGICSCDPRTSDELLVDAHLALVRGTALLCNCVDCFGTRAIDAAAAAANGDEPSASPDEPVRGPLAVIHVHADVETLLGLADNPAYIEGFGYIDPETTRRISADATWQAIIFTARKLQLGILDPDDDDPDDDDPDGDDPDDGDPDGGGPDDTDPDGGDLGGGGPAGQAPDSADPDSADPGSADPGSAGPKRAAPKSAGPDPATDPMGYLDSVVKGLAERANREAEAQARDARRQTMTTPFEDGGDAERWTRRAINDAFTQPHRAGTKIFRTSRFPAGFVPPRSTTAATSGAATFGAGTRIAAWLRFIEDFPDDTYARFPDGHGGYVIPPPGALTYRPSELLKAAVRLRDQTCRHPGCSVPAGACDIDHIVPFDHADPLRGGWTIESDLQALCKQHHPLKTLKLWFHEMLPGALMHTIDPLGTHHITLPGAR